MFGESLGIKVIAQTHVFAKQIEFLPTRTNPLVVVAPMFWFVDRLAIEFKNEFGMSSFQMSASTF